MQGWLCVESGAQARVTQHVLYESCGRPLALRASDKRTAVLLLWIAQTSQERPDAWQILVAVACVRATTFKVAETIDVGKRLLIVHNTIPSRTLFIFGQCECPAHNSIAHRDDAHHLMHVMHTHNVGSLRDTERNGGRRPL